MSTEQPKPKRKPRPKTGRLPTNPNPIGLPDMSHHQVAPRPHASETWLPNEERKYTAEEIAVGAIVFHTFGTGNITQTARHLNLDECTVRNWAKRPEWAEALADIRRNQMDALDGRMAGLMTLALDQLADRLANGDEIVLSDGGRVRRKVSAKDAALIGGMLFDKRQVVRKTPVEVMAAANTDEKLNQIAQRLADMAAEKARTLDVTPSNHAAAEDDLP